jgi:hypothetical protein
MFIAVGNCGTALQRALDLEDLEIITLLVKHGANPNFQGVGLPFPRNPS